MQQVYLKAIFFKSYSYFLVLYNPICLQSIFKEFPTNTLCLTLNHLFQFMSLFVYMFCNTYKWYQIIVYIKRYRQKLPEVLCPTNKQYHLYESDIIEKVQYLISYGVPTTSIKPYVTGEWAAEDIITFSIGPRGMSTRFSLSVVTKPGLRRREFCQIQLRASDICKQCW